MAARTFAAFSGSRPAILASISSSVGPTGAGAAEVRDASGGVFVLDIEKLVTQ